MFCEKRKRINCHSVVKTVKRDIFGGVLGICAVIGADSPPNDRGWSHRHWRGHRVGINIKPRHEDVPDLIGPFGAQYCNSKLAIACEIYARGAANIIAETYRDEALRTRTWQSLFTWVDLLLLMMLFSVNSMIDP
jgi:hypothetical protein